MLSGLTTDAGGEIERRKPIEDGPKAISSWGALSLLFSKSTAAAIARGEPIDVPPWQGADCYWEPWIKPRPSLPIDDCISELIAGRSRKNSARIIDRNEFYEIGLMNGAYGYECPYVYVRNELARAVGIAYDDLRNDTIRRDELPEELDQITDWCRQINTKVARLLERVEKTGFAPPPSLYIDKDDGRLDWQRLTKRHADNIRTAIETFAEVAASAKEKRATLAKGGRPEEVWWVSFIVRCGIIWTTLTGSVPNKGQRAFEDFLRAANESLGGRRAEFDSQIDTALARVGKMQDWDRFDSDFNAVQRPGSVSLAILGPLPEVFLKNRRLFKAATLIVLSRQGNAEAERDLQAVLAAASEEDRGRIADLMARKIHTSRFSGEG